MTRNLLIALLCLVNLRGLAERESPPPCRSLLDEAQRHLVRWDVKQYEQTLRRAWECSGDPEDRVEAGVALANDLWAIQNKPEQAREMLAAAQSLGAEPAWPLLALAELETAAGNHDAACDAARMALSVAASTHDRRRARTHFGLAVCDEVLRATIRAKHPGIFPETTAHVWEAVELLEPLMRDEPGWRQASRSQILLALLAGNGPAAWCAWQSCFLLEGVQTNHHTAFPPPLDKPAEVLAQLLPQFTTETDAATRERVLRALADSRLYPEAAALALNWGLQSNPALRDIVAYGRWTDRVSHRLAEEYHLHTLGKPYRKHYYIPPLLDAYGRTSLEKVLNSEWKRLWREQHPFTLSALFRAKQAGRDLCASFGASLNSPADPGTFSYGHSIVVSEPTIDQYGHQQTMQWLVLDSLVCNGYANWLAEVTGTPIGRVGGWANPPAAFVQVRGDWSLYAWQALTDPDIYRRHIVEPLKRYNAEDEQRAKTNNCGYFPGLALRLYVRGNERLMQRLKDQGCRGVELRTAFLEERERLVNAALIMAHEGRHALDLSQPDNGLSNAELEYRAKCSEVVFAPDPLLALSTGSIFSPETGQPSSHGTADARIMKNLLTWMEAHAGEIRELDRSRPLLPQFDCLSDEQMREAFRSMDPWATPLKR